MKLKPYTGPHAGHLYHVIDDEGRVMRDARQISFDSQFRDAIAKAKEGL